MDIWVQPSDGISYSPSGLKGTTVTQCFKSFISFSTSDVSEMRRLHFFCSSPCLEQFSALIVAWTTAIWGILSPEQLSHLQGITEWSVDMKRTALLEDASGGGGGFCGFFSNTTSCSWSCASSLHLRNYVLRLTSRWWALLEVPVPVGFFFACLMEHWSASSSVVCRSMNLWSLQHMTDSQASYRAMRWWTVVAI